MIIIYLMKLSLTKTATFAVTHFSVAFLTVWALTGDWRIGGLVALIEPVVNTVAYFFHERAWSFRRRPGERETAEPRWAG